MYVNVPDLCHKRRINTTLVGGSTVRSWEHAEGGKEKEYGGVEREIKERARRKKGEVIKNKGI